MKRTVDQSVWDLAKIWVDSQIEEGNDAMMANADHYTDDLAGEIQQTIEDWLQDREDGRPLLLDVLKQKGL